MWSKPLPSLPSYLVYRPSQQKAAAESILTGKAMRNLKFHTGLPAFKGERSEQRSSRYTGKAMHNL
jgi:hypothetical protein